MREIKFRAWDKEHGNFIENPLLTKWDGSTFLNLKEFFSDSDLVWMQYTGLKDKNGKEIYEGDITRYAYGVDWDDDSLKEYEREREGEVKWDKDHSGFSPFCDYDSDCGECVLLKSTEVIGNIYENPELLNHEISDQ